MTRDKVGDIVTYTMENNFYDKSPVKKTELVKYYKYRDQYAEDAADKATDLAIKEFKSEGVNRVITTSQYENSVMTTDTFKKYESVRDGVATSAPEMFIITSRSNPYKKKLSDSINRIMKSIGDENDV